jgi:hypothetical protein
MRNGRKEIKGRAPITKIEAAPYRRSVFANRNQLIGHDMAEGRGSTMSVRTLDGKDPGAS